MVFFHSITIFEIIHLGKMGENKILNFELNHAVAPLLYHSPLPNDPKQEINIRLSGRTAEFINDLPYEKTKVQRILAKTMATNTGHQHMERDTIGITSSSTTLPISNTETISVSKIVSFIIAQQRLPKK